MHSIYRILTIIIEPLMPLFILLRRARGKEDPARMRERLGRTNLTRPEGKLIWLHAASVGEAQSALPLLAALQRSLPGTNFLITTVTVTSAALLEERLAPGILHQFAPLDTPRAVKRFISHWQPDTALFIESELWPNLITAARKQASFMAIVNGRMSERSLIFWQRYPRLIRTLLSCFDLVLAQSRIDQSHYKELGAPAEYGGNLKYDAEPLPFDITAFERLHEAIPGRIAWLCASTHAGEEEIILEAHHAITVFLPNLLTIILPRHAARGPDIVKVLTRRGFTVARRSKGEPITQATDVYLADTMGELGLFYRLAPTVFMGGSLIPHGGQNLLEAARLGCAIMTGPHMFNFTEIVGDLKQRHALLEVRDIATLAAAAVRLLKDPDLRERMGENARTLAITQEGLSERIAFRLIKAMKEPE